MRAARARHVAAALALACGGCSFVAVRRAPPAPLAPDAPLECTQSRVAPALDVAGAVATPVLGLTAWGVCSIVESMQSWSSDPKRLGCGAFLWGGILSAAVYTGAAVYGFHETGTCRRLVAERAPAPGAELPAHPLPANLAPRPPR